MDAGRVEHLLGHHHGNSLHGFVIDDHSDRGVKFVVNLATNALESGQVVELGGFVPTATTEAMLEAARAAMPELPAARAERFERELGLGADRAHQLAFRAELGDFYEAALAGGLSTAVGAMVPVLPFFWLSGTAGVVAARVTVIDTGVDTEPV